LDALRACNLLERAIVEVACLQYGSILWVQFQGLAPQQAAKFSMRILFFRIPAHISEASHAESSLLSFLLVETEPSNVLFPPFIGERCVDCD
jgi:hypothetical protein